MHLGRCHLHRVAVTIKLKSDSGPMLWTRSMEIEGLQVQRGDYDLVVRQTQGGNFDDRADYEKYLHNKQLAYKSSIAVDSSFY